MQADQDERTLPPTDAEEFLEMLQRGLASGLEVGENVGDGDAAEVSAEVTPAAPASVSASSSLQQVGSDTIKSPS